MKQKMQSSLQSGRKVGNYILTRNLGQGTFGKVKLGIHAPTGEKVAVKVLEKSKIMDVSDVERVTRQIHILKQIRHPNVIQLYEIIETPKQLFLVMEYVSEGELFESIVKKKRLKEAEACEYFRQLIAGVEYLHELGIVHRDLKPENLLIDFNKTLKIVDFGLSNTYKPREVLKTACGSPCYAAPEMIAGKKYHGLNADVWSCGVVLFAMICGYLPFEDSNTTVLYKKIIAGEYTLPKFVSPLARDLLQRLLTTDPQRRIRMKEVKTHPWFLQSSDNSLKSPTGIKIGINSIPVDPTLLLEMPDYDQSIQQTKKYVQNNRHNHSITIYYLLLKRQLRNGVQSQYDICSNNFNQDHLVKAEKKPELVKEISESTNTNDLEEIQLDSMALVGSMRPNRIISRISQRRDKEKEKEKERQPKKDESLDVKNILDNLPHVDRTNVTGQQKKRIHQIILSKDGKPKMEQSSLYDIDHQPFSNKFRQTISNGWRKPATSVRISNKFQQKEQRLDERSTSERYRSVDTRDRERQPQHKTATLMNRTFMGKIPHSYSPRFQDESERIRSILNTTVTGHGKRQHKFNFYF